MSEIFRSNLTKSPRIQWTEGKQTLAYSIEEGPVGMKPNLAMEVTNIWSG